MKVKDFFRNKAWKKWDKSQWSIVILTGILLMVIAVPTGNKKDSKEDAREDKGQITENVEEKENYIQEMERRLKNVLSRIEGAGRVEVMITLEDSGERVVEKDTVNETSDSQETDSSGGNRVQRNTQISRETVYQEENNEKTPFVGKERLPEVAGVLIVAQGGEDTVVKQNISEAVMALFQIDVNRIKVVKMNMQEEKN